MESRYSSSYPRPIVRHLPSEYRIACACLLLQVLRPYLHQVPIDFAFFLARTAFQLRHIGQVVPLAAATLHLTTIATPVGLPPVTECVHQRRRRYER